MSTDTTAQNAADESPHDRSESGESLPDTARELLFAAGAFVGVLLFAAGFGFFVLSISMHTTPPAPFFQTTTAKYEVVGASIASMLVGGVVVRASMRLAGW